MTKVWETKAVYGLKDRCNLEDVFEHFPYDGLYEVRKGLRITVEEEIENGVGLWYYHPYHDVLAMPLPIPFSQRMTEIKGKPSNQVETRIKWFTPVKEELPEGLVDMWTRVYPNGFDPNATNRPILLSLDLEKQHKREHHKCPWNGRSIFP